MRTVPLRRGTRHVRLLPAAVLLTACFHGFQPRDYHTQADLYNASLREYDRKKWDNAIAGFERLTLDLPARDTLLPRAHWYLAMAHERRGDHLLAATSFLRLADTFQDDSLADDALLAAGDAYTKLWRNPALDPTYGDLGQVQYRLLVNIFPDSPLREQAEKGVLRIDEMHATKDYENGLTYMRRRAFDSALIYFKDVVRLYPNTARVRDALMRMVEVYRRREMNYQEEARETCTTLRAAYPTDVAVAKLCPAATVAADSAAKSVKPAKPAP